MTKINHQRIENDFDNDFRFLGEYFLFPHVSFSELKHYIETFIFRE